MPYPTSLTAPPSCAPPGVEAAPALLAAFILIALGAFGWCAFMQYAMRPGQLLRGYALALDRLYKSGLPFAGLGKTLGLCLKCHAAIPAAVGACLLPAPAVVCVTIWAGAYGFAVFLVHYFLYYNVPYDSGN